MSTRTRINSLVILARGTTSSRTGIYGAPDNSIQVNNRSTEQMKDEMRMALQVNNQSALLTALKEIEGKIYYLLNRDCFDPLYTKINSQTIGLLYKFKLQYKQVVPPEHDDIVQQQIQRQMSSGMPQSQHEREECPTSFNTDGSCDLFRKLFRYLLVNCCHLTKEERTYLKLFQTENFNNIDTERFKLAQKRKKFIDGVLHNFVQILDSLREYDKI